MMLVSRTRPRCLPNVLHARFTSTSTSPAAASTSQSPADKQDSIFTARGSSWDAIFTDVDSSEKLDGPGHPRSGNNAAERSNDDGPGPSEPKGLLQRASTVRRQRASMTAREMSVFDDMFDLIFNAVSKSKTAPATASSPRLPPALGPSSTTEGVGHGRAPLDDLFQSLRRQAPRVRWTNTIDEELDRKKETMELFDTDYQLFQWLTMELWGDSRQWDEDAKKAIVGTMDENADADHTAKVATSSTSTVTSGSVREPSIDRSIYPHIIAHAMHIFRTTYSNPSLSLAIFNHAAHVSIPSYVFGCTAPAYNELIEAKWEGWGDLEGVCEALEEMRTNGVKTDGRTRIVVERVRREVAEARPAGADDDDDEYAKPFARRVWVERGEDGVMKLLDRIEKVMDRGRPAKSPHGEAWKSAVLAGDDEWRFDGWDEEERKGRRR